MNERNIPNAITLIRLVLILPLIYALLMEHYIAAFFIFTVASISDGVDGYLARRFGWKTTFGAFVDPLADKLLMMTIYLSLAYLSLLPLWLVTLVIARDIIIMTGVLAYILLITFPKFKATLLSKINTTVQLMLATCVLFNAAFPIFPVTVAKLIIEIFIYIVAVTSFVTLVDYVWSWSFRALTAMRRLQ